MVFNILYYPLIIRVFAPEEESVRKYALIFRVESETESEKSKTAYNLKVVRIVIISAEENNASPYLKPQFSIEINPHLFTYTYLYNTIPAMCIHTV